MTISGSPTTAVAAAKPRERKAKITPLPIRQLVAMTFVIVNESICSTMLMPFIGPYVAYMRGVPVNEAGHFSGLMVGMFMIGQVVSAKSWGRLSDRYGRRFPLVSGLFTSGLMMLGFGLSTNVWLCATFRFFHGLFNGNVLVAKTMMADITDKTNQGGGFSFMSLCNAFGFLIGPALGGLLYDPAHSDGLAWAHVSETGFLGTHPAFLPSLVVFTYTNVGMVVCTIFVQESNPHAQPLPSFLRLLYPCMWYKSTPFVLPPIQYETDDEDETREDYGSPQALRIQNKSGSDSPSQEGGKRGSEGGTPWARGAADAALVSTSSSTLNGGPAAPPFSPVNFEDDRRFDHVLVEELIVLPVGRRHARRGTSSVQGGGTDDDDGVGSTRSSRGSASVTSSRRASTLAREEPTTTTQRVVTVHVPGSAGAAASAPTKKLGDASEEAQETPSPSDASGESTEPAAPVVTKFGYREAFTIPQTRFMLSQYMVLCGMDTVVTCFPLFAVATVAAGGLGLSASQVSYILLANSVPCLAANVLFRIVERKYTNKMSLFRVGVATASVAAVILPLTSYTGQGWWIYPLVFMCTATRQVCVSWCYSLNTMLTARAAPPGHVGSIMGINQSCGALVRGLMPLVSAPLFAWSISGHHVIPFNHVFVFFISASGFLLCWWRSYAIRTNNEGQLEMVS